MRKIFIQLWNDLQILLSGKKKGTEHVWSLLPFV